jgi:hypothetical protein
MMIYDEGGHSEEDAEFIAYARTDVLALLAEVGRRRAQVEMLDGLAAEIERLRAEIAYLRTEIGVRHAADALGLHVS